MRQMQFDELVFLLPVPVPRADFEHTSLERLPLLR